MFDSDSIGTLGYLRDPPKKSGEDPDKSFTLDLSPLLTPRAEGDVDMRPYTTQTNQYSAGSCVGNATADSVEILNAIEGLPPVQLSRLFVYSVCRSLMDEDGDGRADLDKDDGTYIRLAFDVISKFGICREDLPIEKGGWPYDLDPRTNKPKNLHVSPSLKSMRAATGHRIHSYYRIYEEGQERIDRILEALRAHHPVVFGTLIDGTFKALRDDSVLTVPVEDTLGGHALIVVGYIQGKGFIIKNSWGIEWGDYGFCYMTPEYLAWESTTDLWVPTKGMMFR